MFTDSPFFCSTCSPQCSKFGNRFRIVSRVLRHPQIDFRTIPANFSLCKAVFKMLPSTSCILKLAQRCLCENAQVVFRVPTHRCMPHLSNPTQSIPAPPHTAQPSPAQTSPIQSRPCQPSPAQPRQGQLNSAQPDPSQPSEAQVFLLRLKLPGRRKNENPASISATKKRERLHQ